MTAAYSLDTNLFLLAWNEMYRPASFPGFWDRLEKTFTDGRALMSGEVLHEVQRKDDGVYGWLKEHNIPSVDLDVEQLIIARGLAKEFPTLAKERLCRQRADGFVIALAQYKDLTVVTAENHRGPEKIPNICDARGIQCITLADMIEREQWRFG